METKGNIDAKRWRGFGKHDYDQMAGDSVRKVWRKLKSNQDCDAGGEEYHSNILIFYAGNTL